MMYDSSCIHFLCVWWMYFIISINNKKGGMTKNVYENENYVHEKVSKIIVCSKIICASSYLYFKFYFDYFSGCSKTKQQRSWSVTATASVQSFTANGSRRSNGPPVLQWSQFSSKSWQTVMASPSCFRLSFFCNTFII